MTDRPQRMQALMRSFEGQVIERMNGLRGGNMAQKWLARQAGSTANLVTRADASTPASTASSRFMQGVTGSEALAGNMAQNVLTGMLGGSTTAGMAAFEAGTGAAIDGAITFGSQEAYDAAQNKPSEEERRDARERGFNW